MIPDPVPKQCLECGKKQITNESKCKYCGSTRLKLFPYRAPAQFKTGKKDLDVYSSW